MSLPEVLQGGTIHNESHDSQETHDSHDSQETHECLICMSEKRSWSGGINPVENKSLHYGCRCNVLFHQECWNQYKTTFTGCPWCRATSPQMNQVEESTTEGTSLYLFMFVYGVCLLSYALSRYVNTAIGIYTIVVLGGLFVRRVVQFLDKISKMDQVS